VTEIHRHLCGKVKSRSHSLRFVRSRELFRNPSCAKPVIICVKFVEIRKKVLKLWSAVFHKFLVNILNKIITHYRWPTTSLFIVNICSSAHLWTFYITVLQFLHSSHFGRKPRIIHNGFPQALMFLTWRKWITARISQLPGLSIAGHVITHSVESRTNTKWPVMWWFTRQWVMWGYLACASSPPLLH
jgi:hypothetical protein